MVDREDRREGDTLDYATPSDRNGAIPATWTTALLILSVATVCGAVAAAWPSFARHFPGAVRNAPAVVPIVCAVVYVYCSAYGAFLVAGSWRTLGLYRLVLVGGWMTVLAIPSLLFLAGLVRTVFL
jgi:hypothetical protein